MANIDISNLTIKFRIYHDRSPSLKEYFANFFKRKSSNSYSEYAAINSVSLTIREGDRVGIIGHNGAGKSTLLKAICRVYESDIGSVTVQGKVAPLLEIGAGFHPEFTGRENIYLNGAILGYDKSIMQSIEKEVTKFAELEEFIDTPVKYYSTGMYMRLAFSLATAVHPDILVLDEIFAGGDASFMKKAQERMRLMIDNAKIMIMVSHDAELVRQMCNRVIWLNHGEIIADGNVNDVLDEYLRSK